MNAYEFNDSQNGLIKDLSQKMRFVGYFSMVVGILAIIGGLFAFTRGGLSSLIQGVIAIVIGLWTLNAANAFKLIVDTQGNDVENLMGALGELRKLYTLQYWLLIIAIIFIALGLISLIFFAATR
ncbi:DUF5362 family protein [Leptothermofonsia sp. ETS-13]|uniref:DUF5362 family protein n=1 Tax=Leptothermofonsia sp. ETS-13 TaxID=3035696 RepID=UPI003BA0444F